jgi:hypothetical protein
MSNCGLRNALREFHGGVVPNTHMRGSKQIDFVLTTGGLTDSIEAIRLLDCSVLNSDHPALFIDLCIEEIFGPSPEKLAQSQYRNLKLDDPRISEEYRKILHNQFECHNIHRRVKEISVQGKDDEWSMQDEAAYELLNKDITEAMLRAERMCAFRKQHATPWTASISKATHTIRYWDARLARKGVHDNQYAILNYYLVPIGYVPGNPYIIWISIVLNSKDMDYSLVYIDIYTSFFVPFTATAVCALLSYYIQ